MSNPSFASTVFKIGYTTKRPDTRAAELFKTGVPTPFVIEFSKYVKNVTQVESGLHTKFASYRINSDREFFNAPIKLIRKSFNDIDGIFFNQAKFLGQLKKQKTSNQTKESFSLKKRRLRRKVNQVVTYSK